jgi:hypothetical protein
MTPRILLRLSLAVVAFVSLARAQDADITTKSVVVPGKRGTPDIRCESTYRGKICIMRVMSDKRASDEFVPYARSFQVGHALVVDSDEDRDGFFETFAVMEDAEGGRTHVEVFRRDRDGTMHTISAQELKKMEDMISGVATFWREALPSK